MNVPVIFVSDEILQVNDTVTRAMSLYMAKVKGVAEANGVSEGANRGDSLLFLQ